MTKKRSSFKYSGMEQIFCNRVENTRKDYIDMFFARSNAFFPEALLPVVLYKNIFRFSDLDAVQFTSREMGRQLLPK